MGFLLLIMGILLANFNTTLPMKKLHVVLLSLLLVIPSISVASISKNLKYGTQGSDVKELQEFLIEKGFLSGDASGNFFSLTRKAVIAYQSSVGLPATGFVGSMTRAKINNDLSTGNTSAVSTEVAETVKTATHANTSNTTTIAQTNTTTLSFVSGCSSSVGFSTTTGKPCSSNVTTSVPIAVNKTATLPNGAIAEIDVRGDFVRWIKEAPTEVSTSPLTTAVVPPERGSIVVSQSNQALSIPSEPLARVTVSPGRVDYRHSATYIKPGTKGYTLAEIEVSSDKKVSLNSITWWSAGSLGSSTFFAKYDSGYNSGASVFPNFGTYVDGVKYDTTPMVDNQRWTFQLDGIVLAPGEKKIIALKTDMPDIICININGCKTEAGAMCRPLELCSACSSAEASSGSCEYPGGSGRTIDFDIRKAVDIKITDDVGKAVVPVSTSTCSSSPEGGICDGSTPWYNGYSIMIESQPPRP